MCVKMGQFIFGPFSGTRCICIELYFFGGVTQEAVNDMKGRLILYDEEVLSLREGVQNTRFFALRS